VAVVNRALAESHWPGQNPIGRVIQFGNMDGDLTPFTIVGVVGDMREASLVEAPRATFYASYRQRPRRADQFNIVVAGDADPAATMTAARRIVSGLRPDVPPSLRTYEAVITASVADRRFL